jgi:hypothetical protein
MSRPSEQRIYAAYIASRQSAALAAAVRIGLFDVLAEAPCDVPALAGRLAVARRPLAGLVRALTAMGLLTRGVHGLVLAPDAATYLVRGRPLWMGGLIDLEVEGMVTPQRVIDALRSDRASVYAGEDPWEVHARDPERARAFTAAMHSISAVAADGFAACVDAAGVGSVLDVGGGSGALSIALARAYPSLRCTVWELPSVCPLAEGYIAAAGLGGRVSALPGDFLRDPWPRGHGAILLSQILHDYPVARAPALLAAAYAALAPRGVLWIHEKLVADDGTGPLLNALVDIDMMVWTDGQQYAPSVLERVLEHAGFTGARIVPAHGTWSVAIAARAPR